ncbi:Plug domain-containing protein [Niabella sp. CC-SYL272]|uniref:Plug domain-containing protein n=1 Tax=Niabella agricola TaxID=2891571 RepID=UPI001F24E93E|nr:Plug domain-containing protein [Niabella agricola]MCF3108911.1 Plug domain-containing protein [Niabella agricola]
MKRWLAFLIFLAAATTQLSAQLPAHQEVVNSAPLFIVDSVVIDNIGDLRPEDIDSLSILKGQEAIAYAARLGRNAAGGVVLIKMKDPRRYLPVTAVLLLRNLKLTAHTLVMVDNKLIEDPMHYRLDTSKPVQVSIEDINRFGYIDTLYKRLKIIKIVTNPANFRTAPEGRLRRDVPAEGQKRSVYIRGTNSQATTANQ